MVIVNAKHFSPSSTWSKPHTYIISLPFFLTFYLHNYGLPSFSLKKGQKTHKKAKKAHKRDKNPKKG